ncbi:CPBP family intramembrane glutamic endopeptidase [Streptomyces sp. NPDC007172]|uniref:CPBP family intramembrane glutamic endopeptidase n=1 Tax=Streptomyces sp. NPDC007172 TaxID=3364776 RepID=UPI0036B0044F
MTQEIDIVGEPRARFARPGVEKMALLCVAVAAGLVLVPGSPTLTLLGSLALLSVTAVVARWPTAPALRAVLCADIVAASFALYVFAGWPSALVTALFVLAPAVAGWLLHRAGRLRPVAPWLAWGRWSRGVTWLFAATVAGTAVALTLWTLHANPKLSDYLSDIREKPVWMVVLGIAGFAIVNAAWEEALFRGVLLTELTIAWGPRAALAIESLTFGISHYNGYPSGFTGVAMSVTWGLVLGALKLWSGGLFIPYIAHVAANTTIGILVYLLL